MPILIAEDETAIKKEIVYDQRDDTLVGFCGKKTQQRKEHDCFDNDTITLGSDSGSYERQLNAFKSNVVATNGRVLIINPLHRSLPKLRVLLKPTCNRFSAADIEKQWKAVEVNCKQVVLQDIVGPVLGHSSDGDSRRRKLMLKQMSSDIGERFRPVPKNLGFIFSALKESDANGSYVLRNVGDKDYTHVHKKLINPLDHNARFMIMGKHVVHMNHLKLVAESFDRLAHNLSESHLQRKDRQNWKVAQEICSLKVQECLKNLIKGRNVNRASDQSLVGTLVYLEIVWHFVEIFISPIATLYQRIKNAAFVCAFLDIWKSFIEKTPELKISKNFITRECFYDTLLSCHAAVIMICYMRENFKDQECLLEQMGSDCCENFCSCNGQWLGSHHAYSFGDMSSNVSNMIRLQSIQVDEDVPKWA